MRGFALVDPEKETAPQKTTNCTRRDPQGHSRYRRLIKRGGTVENNRDLANSLLFNTTISAHRIEVRHALSCQFEWGTFIIR